MIIQLLTIFLDKNVCKSNSRAIKHLNIDSIDCDMYISNDIIPIMCPISA